MGRNFLQWYRIINTSCGGYLSHLGGQRFYRHTALIYTQTIAALITNNFPLFMWAGHQGSLFGDIFFCRIHGSWDDLLMTMRWDDDHEMRWDEMRWDEMTNPPFCICSVLHWASWACSSYEGILLHCEVMERKKELLEPLSWNMESWVGKERTRVFTTMTPSPFFVLWAQKSHFTLDSVFSWQVWVLSVVCFLPSCSFSLTCLPPPPFPSFFPSLFLTCFSFWSSPPLSPSLLLTSLHFLFCLLLSLPFHFAVQQKLTQPCNVIIFQ